VTLYSSTFVSDIRALLRSDGSLVCVGDGGCFSGGKRSCGGGREDGEENESDGSDRNDELHIKDV
jgi:hypothetical protein